MELLEKNPSVNLEPTLHTKVSNEAVKAQSRLEDAERVFKDASRYASSGKLSYRKHWKKLGLALNYFKRKILPYQLLWRTSGASGATRSIRKVRVPLLN
jgi:hypothetical protein